MFTRGIQAAALCALFLPASCGSSPEPREREGSTEAGKALTADESWARAQEKEATGDACQSFARLQWYQESMLEYQWLIDHHPRSRRVHEARRKIQLLRTRVDRLKDWKRKVEDFDTQSRVMMHKPAYLEKGRTDAGALASAPFKFVRDFARTRVEEIEAAARKTVEDALDALEAKVDAFTRERDWVASWEVFGSFDPDYVEIFPETGKAVNALKETVIQKAGQDAKAILEKAEAYEKAGEFFRAVHVLANRKKAFRGLPLFETLAGREKEIRRKAREGIVRQRTIPSRAPAPPPEEEEPAPPDPAPAPGSREAEAAKAMKTPDVKERVPSPEALFAGAADPLTLADRWYYKAVKREKKVLPGDPDYQENLTRSLEMYEKVRALYVHLLEKKKGPDEEIDERIRKVQQAIFWCKKNRGLVFD